MGHQNTKPIKQARTFRRNGRLLSALTRIFAKVDAPEHVITPVGEPFVFAANHRSFFDFIIAWKVLTELGLTCHCLIRADLFEHRDLNLLISAQQLYCNPLGKEGAGCLLHPE